MVFEVEGDGVFDTVQIICEGGCNPDVREYDELVIQVNSGQERLRRFTMLRCRGLHHTPHTLVRTYFELGKGMVNVYVCELCGHRRKF